MGCKPDKLLAFIEEAGLSYIQNSVSYIFTCPKCSKDKKLYIRKRDGRFTCWVCKETSGYQGRPEFVLADLTLQPIARVKAALYGATATSDDEYFDLKVPDFFGEGDEVGEDVSVIETVKWPWNYYEIDHSFARAGREYLARRGISIELAREYGLRYAPMDRRVIFPIEVGNRLVGWQARLVIPHEHWNEEKQDIVSAQKMLSSKGIPSAQTVMFSRRMLNSEHVVVCEGPIDAMKAHGCGGNVSTMGKAIGQGQIDLIRKPDRLTRREIGQFVYQGIKRIYLALDPDAAKETARLVREFSDLDVFVMHPPKPYKDLGEMDPDAVRSLFLRARRVSTANIFVHFDSKR